MSAANDDETNGSPEGLPGRVDAGDGLPKEFVRYLASVALDLQRGMTPSARVQAALRNSDERCEILESLSVEVSPRDVDPVIWSRWLAGGKPPFLEKPAKPELKKPTNASERPSNLVTRTTPRVQSQVAKVEALEADLERERQHLALLRAHDNAAVYFVVVNQLMSIMEPVFAMGPAWTVMRSMSAHLSDEKAEEETALLFGKEKAATITELRKTRCEETQKLLEVLDLGSGNSDFESDLRTALLKVVSDWDKKREKLTADGRRARTSAKLKEEAHPKAQADADEVLEGLKKAS